MIGIRKWNKVEGNSPSKSFFFPPKSGGIWEERQNFHVHFSPFLSFTKKELNKLYQIGQLHMPYPSTVERKDNGNSHPSNWVPNSTSTVYKKIIFRYTNITLRIKHNVSRTNFNDQVVFGVLIGVSPCNFKIRSMIFTDYNLWGRNFHYSFLLTSKGLSSKTRLVNFVIYILGWWWLSYVLSRKNSSLFFKNIVLTFHFI